MGKKTFCTLMSAASFTIAKPYVHQPILKRNETLSAVSVRMELEITVGHEISRAHKHKQTEKRKLLSSFIYRIL